MSYHPDQKRANDGKWTAGGGVAPSHAPSTAPGTSATRSRAATLGKAAARLAGAAIHGVYKHTLGEYVRQYKQDVASAYRNRHPSYEAGRSLTHAEVLALARKRGGVLYGSMTKAKDEGTPEPDDAIKANFNPNQPRGEGGKWTAGGALTTARRAATARRKAAGKETNHAVRRDTVALVQTARKIAAKKRAEKRGTGLKPSTRDIIERAKTTTRELHSMYGGKVPTINRDVRTPADAQALAGHEGDKFRSRNLVERTKRSFYTDSIEAAKQRLDKISGSTSVPKKELAAARRDLKEAESRLKNYDLQTAMPDDRRKMLEYRRNALLINPDVQFSRVQRAASRPAAEPPAPTPTPSPAPAPAPAAKPETPKVETKPFSGYHGRPKKVVFAKGEYAGMVGTIEGQIQKRYSKEPDTFRIQIEGYPKPGGWSGKVTATPDLIADHVEPPAPAPTPSLREQAAKPPGPKFRHVSSIAGKPTASYPIGREVVSRAKKRVETGALTGSEIKRNSVVFLSGNTYAHKDKIKELGGRWDKDAKEWEVDLPSTMRERSGSAMELSSLARRGVRIHQDREVVKKAMKVIGRLRTRSLTHD